MIFARLLLSGTIIASARRKGSRNQWLRSQEIESDGGATAAAFDGGEHQVHQRVAPHAALQRRFPGMARSLGSPSNMSPLSGPPASSEQHGQANGRGRGHSAATAATAPTSLVARSEVGLAAEQASSARSFASMTSSRSTNTRRDDDPVVIPDHTSEVGTVVQPYSGAPSCVVEADDPYSCSFTEADVSHVTAHLQRRAMVSFILLFGLVVLIYLMKLIFEYFQKSFRDVRYFNVMFVKCVENLTILGLIIALTFSVSNVKFDRAVDDILFSDKDPTTWNLNKYASNDVREGAVYPEMSVMLRELYALITGLMFTYVLCVLVVGANLTAKFRKWHRFECEAENEVHVDDDPVDKVSFLLWRRSMLTPMLGHRSEELNVLRNPLQEFSFVQYVQEVLAQYMLKGGINPFAWTLQSLFCIPTSGLLALLFIASVETFLEIETISRAHRATLLGLSTATWSWTLLAFLVIFLVHLRRIQQMLTPPPAALLWHIDQAANPEKLPERHLLPPFRLVPYLKEAPKKTKFFYWWYGTFSPNQHEQLWFRWRKGPSTVLAVLQMAIFLYAVFVAVLVGNFNHAVSSGQGSIAYAVVGWTAAAVSVMYIIPECVIMLLVCSATHMMVNRRAVHAVVQEASQEHHNLSTTLLEMAQIAAMKEKLEHPAERDAFKDYLNRLYAVIFTQDQKDLFEAGWKIHNWNANRGMNPTELKECMEHLGFDDSEIVIGEWWLVFDSEGQGTLLHTDFIRMLTARHVIKYGLISVEDLQALFETHPSGEQMHVYNKKRLSEYLVSFRIEEPRLGALVLIREARYLSDERAGMSDQEIQRKLMDIDRVTVTPQELAEYLYTRQTYRTRLDDRFIEHMAQLRAAAAEAERREELQQEYDEYGGDGGGLALAGPTAASPAAGGAQPAGGTGLLDE